MCCRNKQPHSLTPTKVHFPLPLMCPSWVDKRALFLSHLGARPERATVPNVTSHHDSEREPRRVIHWPSDTQSDTHSAHASSARTHHMAPGNDRVQYVSCSHVLRQESMGPGITGKMTTMAGVRDQRSSMAKDHIRGRGELVEGKPSASELSPRPMGCCGDSSTADAVLRLHAH